MQLQMTAPLDIGLEQNDASLALGQEDMFDLEQTNKSLRKKGGMAALMDESDAESSDSDGADGEASEVDEIWDEEEARERKVANLEAELDGLYDAYQERMKERDAKYQAKKARDKDAERAEWHGLQEKDSDEEEEEDENDEEGGYEKMQAAKSRHDEDSSTDESDDDMSTSEAQVTSRKRPNPEPPEIRKRVRLNPVVSNDSSVSSSALSRSAQVWFSQSMFPQAGIDDRADESDRSEEEEEEEDVIMDEAVSESEVSERCVCVLASC